MTRHMGHPSGKCAANSVGKAVARTGKDSRGGDCGGRGDGALAPPVAGLRLATWAAQAPPPPHRIHSRPYENRLWPILATALIP